MFLGRGFLGEGPGKHELGLEHGRLLLDEAIEGGAHPVDPQMAGEALHGSKPPSCLPLKPASSVQDFGCTAELHEELAGQVLWLNLSTTSEFSLISPSNWPSSTGMSAVRCRAVSLRSGASMRPRSINLNGAS